MNDITLFFSFILSITFPIICTYVFVYFIRCSPTSPLSPMQAGAVCHCNHTPSPRDEKALNQYLTGWVKERPNAGCFKNVFQGDRIKPQIWNAVPEEFRELSILSLRCLGSHMEETHARVTDDPNLLRAVLALALEVSHSRKPVGPCQTGIIGHPN